MWSEVCLGPYHTYAMEFFADIFKYLWLLTIFTKKPLFSERSFVIDIWQSSKFASALIPQKTCGNIQDRVFREDI